MEMWISIAIFVYVASWLLLEAAQAATELGGGGDFFLVGVSGMLKDGEVFGALLLIVLLPLYCAISWSEMGENSC